VRIFRGVKRGTEQPRRSMLDGIGAVLTLGVLVIGTALLAAPRAAEPDLLPLPQPDRRVLRRAWVAEAALAEDARHTALPFSVRAVGETFRRLGAATVHERGVPAGLLHDLKKVAVDARNDAGPTRLLALRAVQTELFIRAARDFERSGQVATELRELGGDFPEVARERGWFFAGHLQLDDEDLGVLFRRRWTDLTQLGDRPPLAPSLDEHRAWYALLLDDARADDRTAMLAVAALGRLDPSYPAGLARGVLFYRRGAYGAAAQAFRDQLNRRADGAWRLRTRNHLLAALRELPEEQ
jgi:hypothetical protein